MCAVTSTLPTTYLSVLNNKVTDQQRLLTSIYKETKYNEMHADLRNIIDFDINGNIHVCQKKRQCQCDESGN